MNEFWSILVGEKNLPENNVVHCLWIAVWSFHHSELLWTPDPAHRHIQLAVSEDGAPVPHSNKLESLSCSKLLAIDGKNRFPQPTLRLVDCGPKTCPDNNIYDKIKFIFVARCWITWWETASAAIRRETLLSWGWGWSSGWTLSALFRQPYKSAVCCLGLFRKSVWSHCIVLASHLSCEEASEVDQIWELDCVLGSRLGWEY